MKKILFLAVITSCVLCGCGKNIHNHESQEYSEQKKKTIECFSTLQKKLGDVLNQWDEKSEYSAKDQEKFRDAIFLLDKDCMAAVIQASNYKMALIVMDCPPKCDHLFHGNMVESVGRSCESISKRGREILSGSFADMADKLEHDPLKRFNSRKSKITSEDRITLSVLYSQITTTILLLEK